MCLVVCVHLPLEPRQPRGRHAEALRCLLREEGRGGQSEHGVEVEGLGRRLWSRRPGPWVHRHGVGHAGRCLLELEQNKESGGKTGQSMEAHGEAGRNG